MHHGTADSIIQVYVLLDLEKQKLPHIRAFRLM
jgi:hypothetical protein